MLSRSCPRRVPELDVVLKNMKIHHTIQIPRGYDRLDELKNYIAEKYSSDGNDVRGFHGFAFEEADTDRPKWIRTVPPDGCLGVIQKDSEPAKHLMSHFGLREYVLRFPDAT